MIAGTLSEILCYASGIGSNLFCHYANVSPLAAMVPLRS